MTFLNGVKTSESTDNSTTSTLTTGGSGLTYTGTWEDVIEFSSIHLVIKSNVDSAAQGVHIQWSTDGSTVTKHVYRTYKSPGEFSEVFRRGSRHVRIVYTSSVDQSSFSLKMYKDVSTVGNSMHPQTIQLEAGAYDAFRRIRMTNPHTIWQVSHNDDKQNESISEKLENGATATHNANESAVDMVTTTTASSKSTRQSRMYMQYQPGKSFLILATGVLNANSNGVDCETRIGLFDDDNGVFFQYANGLGVTLRSKVTGSVVNNLVAQADWNYDTMDGNGVSGFSLDDTKANIFAIDLAWLGVGDVRCCVLINGKSHPVHIFRNANVNSTVYMSRAALPIRYQIENTATTNGVGTLKMICSTVISEGGFESLGHPGAIALMNGEGISNVGTTLLPIVSIRLKSGFSRAIAKVFSVSLLSTTSNTNLVYEVWHFQGTSAFDPATALTGESWTSAGPGLIVEYDRSATAITTTNGNRRYVGYVANDLDAIEFASDRVISLTSDIDDQRDIVVLACMKINGTDDTVYGGLKWTEIHT